MPRTSAIMTAAIIHSRVTREIRAREAATASLGNCLDQNLITVLDRRYWPLFQRPHLAPSANLGLVASHRNGRVSHPCARDR